MIPRYGFYCVSCETYFPDDPGKHSDADGFKCRDSSGSAASAEMLSPVATRSLGPRGILRAREMEQEYLDGQIAIARGYGPR